MLEAGLTSPTKNLGPIGYSSGIIRRRPLSSSHTDSASLPNDLFVLCSFSTPNPKGEVTTHGYAVSDGLVEAVVVVVLDMEHAVELVPTKNYFLCLHDVNFTTRWAYFL
jgi:hypothetical protein